MKRYDLGTSRESGIGQPGITEQPNGAYVRHDDHQALMQEKDAEIVALERTVVDQTVVITELREGIELARQGLGEPFGWGAYDAATAKPVLTADDMSDSIAWFPLHRSTQPAESVKEPSDDMVDRACRIQHVGWSLWHEPQKKTAREVMRHALTSALYGSKS